MKSIRCYEREMTDPAADRDASPYLEMPGPYFALEGQGEGANIRVNKTAREKVYWLGSCNVQIK